MTARQAARTAQAMDLRIEIDQSAITAPDFPREVEWWRRYLPPWFVQERSWDMDPADWDLSGIALDSNTGAVVIDVGANERRARATLRYLQRDPLTRYMTDPATHIRLVETPAGGEQDRKSTKP